jgi:hypothetical protein
MSVDDDDDDVAIADGQEPPTDDKGEPIVAAAGGGVTETIQVKKGTRPVSDTVRRVFAESMAKAKAKGSMEVDSGLEPVEHEDLPTEAAAVEATSAQAAQEQAVSAAAQATAAPVAAVAPPVAGLAVPPPVVAPPIAPAPSLDPEVVRIRTELQQEREKLQQEREQFAVASRASDIAKLRDTYYDKGAPAIAEVIKQWMPGLSDAELKDEVADLIQDLAHQYLEAPLEQTVKDRIATKRTRQGLKNWRTEQDRLQEEQQKKLLATQQEETRARVRTRLHQEVTKPEYATTFPFLSSEANAGDLVFETIDQEYRNTGQTLKWEEAAKRLDDWLKSQALAFYDKRKHLLSPQPPLQQQPVPSDKQRAQGDNQVSRSLAPPKPPEKPTPPQERPVSNQKWTAERHRESVKSKFRQQFKNQFADEE